MEMLLSIGADRSAGVFPLRTELKECQPQEFALLLGYEDIATLL